MGRIPADVDLPRSASADFPVDQTVSDFLSLKKREKKGRRTSRRDNTRYCLHHRMEECCHRWHNL
jgi:hypothetical protein